MAAAARGEDAHIAFGGRTQLPFPAEFDNGALEDVIGPISWTPLAEGVRQTIDRLRGAPD
jgi:hypothetical protein